MTFEEFFTRKRIDLPALEKAEPSLFSEFKTHFNQMGEKSFDHTKKYLFNKLRHQFHLAPEIKPDKVAIANPLAEQTITESLTETIPPATPAKQGFTPRFKTANMAKPAVAEEQADEPLAATESASTPSPPKVGFTPRFKAANMAKPTVTEDKIEEKPAAAEPAPTPPKVGFTPRFKAANMPKPAVADEKIEEKPAEPTPPAEEKTAASDAPKPAYKPRFNMKNIPPRSEE